jgi:hypothetical protein
MVTITAAEKKQFEILAQRLHIEFVENSQLDHADSLDKDSFLWRMIDFLEDLQDFEFDEYKTADKENFVPIRQRKARTILAGKLVHKAKELKSKPSEFSTPRATKESTWRFKTEVPIFSCLEEIITW